MLTISKYESYNGVKELTLNYEDGYIELDSSGRICVFFDSQSYGYESSPSRAYNGRIEMEQAQELVDFLTKYVLNVKKEEIEDNQGSAPQNEEKG